MKCEIICDLLPLYCDGLCSEASRQEIEAHVVQCEGCRTCLAEMKEEPPLPPLSQESETEARVLQGVKKKFSCGRRRAVLIAVAVMLIFSIVLAGAADVPQPVSYTDGLVTDFETATYQVDRQVDAVYYLVGDYLQLPGLAQAEFERAVADAVLLWER